ncbi:MAG: HAD-IIA family hydrolase [Lentisphaerae bacterium]|nr:HAD-IIA family hydrolase [Lentisphaerota bacterium]
MRKSKMILFDLDGTLYLDGKLFPGVIELLEKLRRSSLQYGFLTNNSTIGPEDYYQKLKALGLPLSQENVFTSCEASSLMLKTLGIGPHIYVLGTAKFRQFMQSEGFIHCYEKAQALLVGFDTELDYRKLTEATRLVLKGLPLYASHPDPICPGDLPDAGMLLEYFKAAKPGTIIQGIAGKPHRWIVELIENRFQVHRSEIIMVGDRINTDMRFAANFGMRSILVLNGIEQPELGDIRPDCIAPHIRQLLDQYWPENLPLRVS